MIVAGSMIGSGIFIVSADIARQVGSSGWLLAVWLITGLLTLAAALSYGELAAMMRRAGNMSIYGRPTARSGDFSTGGQCSSSSKPERSPLWPWLFPSFWRYLSR